ncbi:MAG: hypothetical protein ACFB9N_05945 [Geitlerinemataceae cyanobacterium]
MLTQTIRRFSQLSALVALPAALALAAPAIAAPLPEARTIGQKSEAAEALYPSFASLFAIETLEGLPQMEGVNLSAEQASQIAALLDDARIQIQTIFTAEQQNTLVAELNRGEDFNLAMEAIGLSEAQESDLEFIVQYFGFQAGSILTPEQQQTISENFQASR